MKLKILLLAAAAVISTPALADTAAGGSLSYTGPTDFSGPLGFLSKFNSAAGVLNSVTFTYGYSFDSSITVIATTPASGSVATESALQFSSSDSAINSVLNSVVNTTSATLGASHLNPAAFDLTGRRSVYSLSPGEAAQYSSGAMASLTKTVTTPSLLSAFLAGSGTNPAFALNGSTLTGLLLTATGGNAIAFNSTIGTASFGLVYDYTPTVNVPAVPEPATWAMMLIGFGGVGYAMRRGRRVAIGFS